MSWVELVAVAARIRDVAGAADASLGDLPLAGIGWATVEADRAFGELDAELDEVFAQAHVGGAARPSWAPAARDPALGARVWLRASASGPANPWLVVLEPDTESRIAASLARFGEGVAVAYLGEGQIRPGRLVRGGPSWGPHVVILGGAGDIEPPRGPQ